MVRPPVYRARDTMLGRDVALKVPHVHLTRDADYLERFLREARTAASFSHPNVVTIYEVGQEGTQHFIAMELLPIALDKSMKDRGRIPLAETLSIIRQVALALEAAHERGIVHRDLKPQNILLTEDGTPKVTDFGIARAAEYSRLTATGMVLGTPQYMSPEQARGDKEHRRIDHRA